MSEGPKIIAFYLPQFHPIPENDEWWGTGFTEWTNTTKATPSFPSHYQPQLPADLGFYDLRVREVRVRQAELARQYNIYGFCYYYYWFSGRQLLETPILDLLKSKKPNFPFCICWANENWTRTWDGRDTQILIKQNYYKDDPRKFIKELVPFFEDKRYIRVAGKPLLIVYRPAAIPRAAAVTEQWRSCAKEHGIGDLHLCAALTFGQTDPRILGFDSGVEFPPHGVSAAEVNPAELGAVSGFSGKIYRYPEVVLNELCKKPNSFKTFRTAMAGWDNSPRTGLRGYLFTDASPMEFEIWLHHLISQARSGADEFVFVNAWNEWAEGAHLEPDRRHGRGWLEAVRNATMGRSTAETALEILRSHAEALPDYACRAIETLAEAIATNRRSLNIAAQLMREKASFVELFSPVHLTSEQWEEISTMPCCFTGRGWLDRINGLPEAAAPDPFEVLPGQSLSLVGWLVSPGIEVGEHSELLVLVQNVVTKVEAYGVELGRVLREDVVADFAATYPAAETRYSGFEFSLSLAALAPGRYEIFLGSVGETVVVYAESPVSIVIPASAEEAGP
jgi:hypothetical protein